MNLADATKRIRWRVPTPDDPAIGDAFGGGYYFGKMNFSGLLYWMVVADKSAEKQLAVKTTSSASAGTGSTYDGLANTQAMLAENPALYPAASYCNSYVDSAGNTDYYFAAIYELELLYRNLKPRTINNTTSQNPWFPNPYSSPAGPTYTTTNPSQTPLLAFREKTNSSTGSQAIYTDGTVRWISSTQHPTYPGEVYNYRMDDGFSGSTSKPTKTLWMRPIRRILIPGQ